MKVTNNHYMGIKDIWRNNINFPEHAIIFILTCQKILAFWMTKIFFNELIWKCVIASFFIMENINYVPTFVVQLDDVVIIIDDTEMELNVTLPEDNIKKYEEITESGKEICDG